MFRNGPPEFNWPDEEQLLLGKTSNKKGHKMKRRRDKGRGGTANLPASEASNFHFQVCILLAVGILLLALILYLTRQPKAAADVNYNLREHDGGTDTDGEEDLFEAINKLTAHGINAGGVNKLQDAGIYTCNGLMLLHIKKHLQPT